MKLIRSAALSGLLLASTTVQLYADDGYEARLAVARDYLQLTMQDLDMPALIRQMWQPVADQYAAQGAPLTEAQKAALDALYQKKMTAPMRDILLRQDEVMADLMSLEEITALRDFYKSDLGRSVMQKLPDILARQQPMILEMVQSQLPAILPDLYKILDTD